MTFSRRTELTPEPSGLDAALQRLRASGGPLLDLTVSNPTRCGLLFDSGLLEELASPDARVYRADPLGGLPARQAIAQMYYQPRGVSADPAHLLLSASTSEAYGWLLRLLCNPGDRVLVPSPSYPLFQLLAQLHDVELATYPLVFHDGWQIDPAGLASQVDARTRAVIVVHPNNPTGNFAGVTDREVLRRLQAEHGFALIADEVFLDYTMEPREPPVSFAAEQWPGLCFVLSGLSKVLALPQMKLAWTLTVGPERLVREAMNRLEVIADTFLSVATPVQLALPAWLQAMPQVQAAVLERVGGNLACARRLAGELVQPLPVEGGWSVLLRVPALGPDTDLAMQLLTGHGVAVHPGSFFGLPHAGYLVLSLLPEPADFAAGFERVIAAIDEAVNRVSAQQTLRKTGEP